MALNLALEDILIKAPTEAAAFAAGLAIHPTLSPLLRDLENFTWSEHPSKRLDLVLAAEVAAEDVDSYDDMATEASYSGWDADRFKWAYGVTLNAPGSGELLTMLRRGTIGADDYTHGLRKAKLETRWDGPLADLKHVYLSPDVLAVMLQRSVIPNQGQLPGVNLDTTGRVPRFPQVDLDAYKLAGYAGWSAAQLDAQTRIQGLPPGMDLVARGVFRDIFARGDFNLAAEQSNRRVEWADLEFEAYRQIPTADAGVQWHLRGWTDAAGMYAQTARHGMSKADTDLLFQIHGRPLSWHQIFTGLNRGGVYDGPTTDLDPAFLKGLRESDIRPEWYNLAWAQRYNYPTAFVLRSLTQAGDLTEAETHQILIYENWEPALAAKVAQRWATAGTGTSGTAKIDPWLAKAHSHLWTAVQKGYIGGSVDQPNAEQSFAVIGIDQAVHPAIFAAWDEQRRIEAL